MQPELEQRHHAKIAATTAHRPEQLRLVRGIGPMALAVGRDHFAAQQVVDGHAVLPREPAKPTAQRQSGHARGGIDAERRGQAQCLRLVVEIAQRGARADPGHTVPGIDMDAAQLRQVHHQPVVADGAAGDVVPAAAHGNRQAMIAREIDGLHDVRRTGALHNDRRPAVDGGIPDGTRDVVSRVVRQQHLAAHGVAQHVDMIGG